MDPILKWVGGKRKLLPELLSRLPSDVATRRHVEPFAGGAALFFAREPAKAWLSDANASLIEFYDCCAVEEELDRMLCEAHRWSARYRKDAAGTYAEARRAFNASYETALVPWVARREDAATRSALFLFFNRTCFNGLWRVNKKGAFNVPMGRYKNPTIVNEEELRKATTVLLAADIESCAFGDVGYDTNDFVYFDPPYVPLSPTSSFTSYASGGFGAAEQRRLAALFDRLSEGGIPCMLSNSDTPFVRDLYAKHRIETVHAARSINSDATKRGTVAEVLVRNEACCR